MRCWWETNSKEWRIKPMDNEHCNANFYFNYVCNYVSSDLYMRSQILCVQKYFTHILGYQMWCQYYYYIFTVKAEVAQLHDTISWVTRHSAALSATMADALCLIGFFFNIFESVFQLQHFNTTNIWQRLYGFAQWKLGRFLQYML